MLELVRSTKSVKLDGKIYNLKNLTKAQALHHQGLVKDANGDDAELIKIFSNLLKEIGLPEEVIEGLEVGHFTKIAHYLFDTEKK